MAPTRLLAHYLPAEEGGFEDPRSGQMQQQAFQRATVPWHAMPKLLNPDRIAGDPLERLASIFAGRFQSLLLEPNRPGEPKKPRDCILRGQFDDAAPVLVDILSQISKVQQRLAHETKLDEEAANWLDEMRSNFAIMSKAERSTNANLTDAAYLTAKAKVTELMTNREKIMLVIERAAAEPWGAEATFQLALCKHEQAERLSRARGGNPAEREGIQYAWENAASWWNNFLTQYGAVPGIAPGQPAHARELRKQAQDEHLRAGAKQEQ
jgi:hypothetical protein